MSDRVWTVPVRELSEGMVLEEGGEPVTPGVVERLSGRGIHAVKVRAALPAVPEAVGEAAALAHRIDEVLSVKFRGFEDDFLMSAIRALAFSNLMIHKRVPHP